MIVQTSTIFVVNRNLPSKFFESHHLAVQRIFASYFTTISMSSQDVEASLDVGVVKEESSRVKSSRSMLSADISSSQLGGSGDLGDNPLRGPPVANPLGASLRTEAGDRNISRPLRIDSIPTEFSRWSCVMLALLVLSESCRSAVGGTVLPPARPPSGVQGELLHSSSSCLLSLAVRLRAGASSKKDSGGMRSLDLTPKGARR
mmetsp:Transcript_18346/g.60249  ORF Transcript_18346/g.60249 Transcript_18346/m.60249 type:complete len:203 (+) Transcript_18346:767-1375(+)